MGAFAPILREPNGKERPASRRCRRLSPPRTVTLAFAPTVRLRLLPIVP